MSDAPFQYNPLSDEEVKKLALDYVSGQVFTSNQSPDSFMAFLAAMGDLDGMDKFLRDHNIVLAYEYLHKAGPVAVNGNPVFFSHHWLNKNDYDRFAKIVNDLLAAQRQVLESVS